SAVTVNPRFANFAPLGPALNAAANSAALLTGVVSSRVSVLPSTDTVSVVGLVAKSIGAAAGLKAKGRLAAVGGMGDREICRLSPLPVISSRGEATAFVTNTRPVLRSVMVELLAAGATAEGALKVMTMSSGNKPSKAS